MGREAECHNQCDTGCHRNTGSRAAASRSRRVLNVADSPESIPEPWKPALLLVILSKQNFRQSVDRFQFYVLARSMPEAAGFSYKVQNGDYSRQPA